MREKVNCQIKHTKMELILLSLLIPGKMKKREREREKGRKEGRKEGRKAGKAQREQPFYTDTLPRNLV